MFRRILWILVAIAAGLGLLISAAGLVGAWIFNTPLTDAVTATADTVDGYLTLADTTTTAASTKLADVRTQLDTVGARLDGITPETRAAFVDEATAAFENRFGPTVSELRTTFSTLRTGIAALNQTLESANRIPGVTVPTFTDELQTAQQRIDAFDSKVGEIQNAVAAAEIDGDKVRGLITTASAEVASVEEVVNQWRSQITAVDEGITRATAAAPGLIDLTSLALSLLFILFGAGQLSLLLRAIDAVRGHKTPA